MRSADSRALPQTKLEPWCHPQSVTSLPVHVNRMETECGTSTRVCSGLTKEVTGFPYSWQFAARNHEGGATRLAPSLFRRTFEIPFVDPKTLIAGNALRGSAP